jgi:hypothetical protein
MFKRGSGLYVWKRVKVMYLRKGQGYTFKRGLRLYSYYKD